MALANPQSPISNPGSKKSNAGYGVLIRHSPLRPVRWLPQPDQPLPASGRAWRGATDRLDVRVDAGRAAFPYAFTGPSHWRPASVREAHRGATERLRLARRT